jgi:hypothetical protein
MEEIKIGSRVIFLANICQEERQFFIANRILFPYMFQRLTVVAILETKRGLSYGFKGYNHLGFFQRAIIAPVLNVGNLGIEVDVEKEANQLILSNEDLKI